MVNERGLSYTVGILMILVVTLGAVVVFTQVLGFQAGVLTSLQALDVRRLGESLVPVEGISKAGDIIVYNNGLIPTCFLEVRVVGTTYGYSVTNCNLVTTDVVPPRQYVTLTCVNIINISTLATIPCTTWGITFVPSSTITVPAGRVGTIGVEA
jgi:hypothetical protein